jgi:hypothetical protein
VGGFIDRLIAKDIVMIFYALWLLRKVMALRERKTFVEAEPLLVSLIIFVVFSLYYLWVFLDYKFSNAVPESLAKTFIESMDIQVFITVS